MPIVRVGSEQTLAELVDRMTKAGTSKKANARVQSAIEAANPGLDPSRLSRGDIVLVPESAELLRSVERGAQPDGVDLFDRLGALLQGWNQAAEATDQVSAAERDEVSKILRDTTLKRAADENPDLAAALESLSAQNREETARAKASAKARARRVEEATASLQALRTQVRRSAGP